MHQLRPPASHPKPQNGRADPVSAKDRNCGLQRQAEGSRQALSSQLALGLSHVCPAPRGLIYIYAPVRCKTAVTMPSGMISRASRLGAVMLVQVTHDTEFGPVVDLFVEMVEHERGLVALGVFVSDGT